MATVDTSEKVAAPPVKGKTPTKRCVLVEVVLRFLLFGSALAAVVVMVTSKQTENVPVPITPLLLVPRTAKFSHSPAFIFFVAAMSFAGLYGMISTLVSFYSLLKPGCCSKASSHFIILDVVLLGIVASATGAAGGVAYIGLKGNSHVGWRKVCNTYDTFCRHIGASVALSLLASLILTLLVLISVHSLSKKIPK